MRRYALYRVPILVLCVLVFAWKKMVLPVPVFEDDGFPSELCDGIKAQHGVTFVGRDRLWLHFPWAWIWACDRTSGINAHVLIIFPPSGVSLIIWLVILYSPNRRELECLQCHPRTAGSLSCTSRRGTSGRPGLWNGTCRGRGPTRGSPRWTGCKLRTQTHSLGIIGRQFRDSCCTFVHGADLMNLWSTVHPHQSGCLLRCLGPAGRHERAIHQAHQRD